MVVFKHYDLLLPIKRIIEVHQHGGYRQGAKITKVTENLSLENLGDKKSVSYLVVETDAGEWISSSVCSIQKNELGVVIIPKQYYDIEGKDFVA